MPDRIYAIGGGGIKLVKSLFEQDWVMREALEPSLSAGKTKVHMFDSALEERDGLREDVDAIRERCEETKAALREEKTRSGDVGDLEFNTHVLTDGLNLTSALDLTEPSIVERISQERQFDAEDWWIKRTDIRENRDFSNGVYRRRALARATYLKAIVEDPSISNDIDMKRRGSVAVVVGLGGGTGSGLCIDFCRQLLDESPSSDVTLFGVLPTTKEDARECANAYAALSELEQVQLGGDHGTGAGDGPLFKDVVLFPIDQTNYEGKKGDRISTSAELGEFDTAFAYPFLSYYNTGDNEELFDDAPGYAPFVIAIPQVLRYNVDAIRTAQESLKESVSSLKNKYQAGHNIHKSAFAFLTSQFDGSGEESLTKDQKEGLRLRLEELETFVGTELFRDQGYASAETFEENVLGDARKETNGDITQIIEKLDLLGSDLTQSNLDFVDETDEDLAETIEVGIEFLKSRLEVLEEISVVQDRTIREALSIKLNVGRSSINSVKLQVGRVQDRCDELDDDAMILQKELEEIEQKLEEARNEQKEAVGRRSTTWKRATESTREQLRRASEIDYGGLFDSLDRELKNYCKTLEDAESKGEVQAADKTGIKDALAELERGLERVGLEDGLESTRIELIPRRVIERSMDTLEEARLASLNTDAGGGILSRLWKTSADRKAEQAVNDLREAKANLTGGLFEAERGEEYDFSARVRAGSELDASEVERFLKEKRREVLGELSDVLEGDLDQSSRDEFHRLLANDQFSDSSNMAKKLIERDLALPDELTETRDSLQTELADKRSELERYEAMLEELESSTVDDGRQAYEEAETAFQEARGRYAEVGDNVSTDNDHLYIKRVQPQKSVYDQKGGDIKTASLLEATGESQRAKGYVDDFAGKTLHKGYLGLKQRVINDGIKRYEGRKVSIAMFSKAREENISDLFDGLGRTYRGSFGKSEFGSWREEIAHNWDVGMSAFISGVCLDNLRNITDYRSAYLERMVDASSIHMHHALGLEDGALSRRAKLLNMEDQGDVGLLTGAPDETVVTEQLLGWTELVSLETARTGNPELGAQLRDPEGGPSANVELETDGGDD